MVSCLADRTSNRRMMRLLMMLRTLTRVSRTVSSSSCEPKAFELDMDRAAWGQQGPVGTVRGEGAGEMACLGGAEG